MGAVVDLDFVPSLSATSSSLRGHTPTIPAANNQQRQVHPRLTRLMRVPSSNSSSNLSTTTAVAAEAVTAPNIRLPQPTTTRATSLATSFSPPTGVAWDSDSWL